MLNIINNEACSRQQAALRAASDEELIGSIAGGDKRGMQALFERHSARIYRFILRLTNDPSLTEDIVSEVFVEVWRSASGFRFKSQVPTWLLGIARNKAVSKLRRRTETHLDDNYAAAIEDPTDDPETALDKKERCTLLQTCLTKLSLAQQEVIDLIYFRHKSIEEVAQIVGIQVSTVKTRMFYARSRMAVLLKDAGLEAAWS